MEDGAKGEDEVLKLISKLMSLMPSGVDLEIGRMDDRATWRMTGGTPEQRASAQAILDAFDPAQAQAEVEAEEKARAEKAAALDTLADWMAKNPTEATKLLEAPSKLAVIETKVAAIEAKVVAVEPKVIPK